MALNSRGWCVLSKRLLFLRFFLIRWVNKRRKWESPNGETEFCFVLLIYWWGRTWNNETCPSLPITICYFVLRNKSLKVLSNLKFVDSSCPPCFNCWCGCKNCKFGYANPSADPWTKSSHWTHFNIVNWILFFVFSHPSVAIPSILDRTGRNPLFPKFRRTTDVQQFVKDFCSGEFNFLWFNIYY
jgi:hypothetical protein